MGGAGIAAKILYDETSAKTDPLGPENRLIFMPGVFTGSMIPSSGRHSVVAKSPLTGIYGESDIGGSWGVALKRAGYDGIVVTGQSQSPSISPSLRTKSSLRTPLTCGGRTPLKQTICSKRKWAKGPL